MNRVFKNLAMLINETYLYKILSYMYYRPRNKDDILWEEKKSYGNMYEDKCFYVIRVNDPHGDNGLMAIVCYCLGHLYIAEKKGYIPIIDMQNYPNIYLNHEDIYIYNAWNFFFKNVSEYSLEDIKEAKNVILSSTRFPMDRPVFSSKRLYKNIGGEQYKWRSVMHRYCQFNSELMEEVEENRKKFFEQNEKVIGVLCRGTDYNSLKIEGHPIQPSYEQIYSKTSEFMHKYNCAKVYIATEDMDAYAYFKERLKDKLYINKEPDIKYDDTKVISESYPSETEMRKKIGKDYLISLGILAKCDYFISGRNGGSLGVYMISDGFKETFSFDLGIY